MTQASVVSRTFGRPPRDEAPKSHAHNEEEDEAGASGGQVGRGLHGQHGQAADLWKGTFPGRKEGIKSPTEFMLVAISSLNICLLSSNV